MTALIVAIVVVFLVIIAILLGFLMVYRKVEQGDALIINKVRGEPNVTFTGGIVVPILHMAEFMDISVKTITVDRRGTDGLICQDNIRADITVAFYVRVNKSAEDVLKVASAVGVKRASDMATLEQLFQAKFSEALKTVGKQMDFVELYNERKSFKDRIIATIGTDLNGYLLEDTAIDYLEQTPLEHLDADNILDSEGIRKITNLTEEQRKQTNLIKRDAEKTIKKQDVEAKEAILALEKVQSEAEAIQEREVEIIRAREKAEIEKVQFEEHKRSEEAKIAADQEIGVQRENAMRETEIAGKNRERAIAVEAERVEKERELENVNRQRAVELSTIEKEKAIEVERKAIADVVRERVAVEKTVAEEEERTKDVRAHMTAEREKSVKLTAAEQEAQEKKIKDVTAAQAAEAVAAHLAKEVLIEAEAKQAAADKNAAAEIRLAEGKQATAAAEGLAAARVKEADAIAIEKEGLAKVAVERAEVSVIEERGKAEAEATEAKMRAEATGIAEKATSMAQLTDATKDHEEFRLRLQNELEIAKEQIGAQIKVTKENAGLLATALADAKFDIVGGDGAFFDRFVNAISLGKSIDGAVGRSEHLGRMADEYRSGDRSLAEDVTQVLTKGRVEDLKDLAAAGVLRKISKGGGNAEELIAKAKELGFGDAVAGWLNNQPSQE